MIQIIQRLISNSKRKPTIANDSSCNSSSHKSASSMSVSEPPPNVQRISAIDLWMLGITIVIGGQYFGWNLGLSCGFGAFAIATFLMGSAYYCLILCAAEISSGLPFAGGAYGLARVSLGYYLGFGVGCSEIIEYILYTSASALALGRMVEVVFDISEQYAPVIWFLFYASSTSIHIYGGRTFWIITYILAIISFIIEVLYLLGALAFVDFNKYAGIVMAADDDTVSSNQAFFIGGGNQFMTALFNAAWFYVGIESLAFASDVTIQPKKNMPRGSLSCMTTLALGSILMLFICCSLPPGESSTGTIAFPLNKGFSLMFGISDKAGLIFSIPATYATAYGFMFPYGKLLQSLAESNLLPSPLKWTTSFSGTPYVALILGSTFGFVVCVAVYFYEELELIIFETTMLSAFLGYISQAIGYIAMQTKFQSIKREFHSPLGIFGAIYCILVFGLCALSVVAFQTTQHALFAVISIQTMTSIYYFSYAKKRQTFSPEESKILFVAHVITHNTKGKSRQRPRKIKTSKVQPSAQWNPNHSDIARQSNMQSVLESSAVDDLEHNKNHGPGQSVDSATKNGEKKFVFKASVLPKFSAIGSIKEDVINSS